MDPIEWSQRVLKWFDAHGRKQLPWQQQPTPYQVWVSEIMLQQTQVITVIPYYQRFIERFPTIQALAVADLDAVLQGWAGLGYYARARNLHQAARLICEQYGGEMPLDHAVLQTLPGIGRSTAGAILALSVGQRHPILDGNVKRLLARFAAIEGWPGQAAVMAALWELAERYTPTERVAAYTQAVMDLGALICTPHRPHCGACPLKSDCIAYTEGRVTDFPYPKPRRDLPVRTTRMLLLRLAPDSVLLEHRPPVGIWGGLWSLPECPLDANVADWCQTHLGISVVDEAPWRVVRHSFSHFHLDITPTPARVIGTCSAVMEGERWVWYNPRHLDSRAVAAPVRRLLAALATTLDW